MIKKTYIGLKVICCLIVILGCAKKDTFRDPETGTNIFPSEELSSYYNYLDTYLYNDTICVFADDTMSVKANYSIQQVLAEMPHKELLRQIKYARHKVDNGDMRYKLFFDNLYSMLYDRSQRFELQKQNMQALMLFPETKGLCRNMPIEHIETTEGFDWSSHYINFLLFEVLEFNSWLELDALAMKYIDEGRAADFDSSLRLAMKKIFESDGYQYRTEDE